MSARALGLNGPRDRASERPRRMPAPSSQRRAGLAALTVFFGCGHVELDDVIRQDVGADASSDERVERGAVDDAAIDERVDARVDGMGTDADLDAGDASDGPDGPVLSDSLATTLTGVRFRLAAAARAGSYVYACGEDTVEQSGVLLALRESRAPVVHLLPGVVAGRSLCHDIVAIGGERALAVGEVGAEGVYFLLQGELIEGWRVRFSESLEAIAEASPTTLTAFGLREGRLGIYEIEVGGSTVNAALTGFPADGAARLSGVDGAVRAGAAFVVATRRNSIATLVSVEAPTPDVRWATSFAISTPMVLQRRAEDEVVVSADGRLLTFAVDTGAFLRGESLGAVQLVDANGDFQLSTAGGVGLVEGDGLARWTGFEQGRFTQNAANPTEVLLAADFDEATTLLLAREEGCPAQNTSALTRAPVSATTGNPTSSDRLDAPTSTLPFETLSAGSASVEVRCPTE
ncbi:MAG: hypothetical protein AAF411_11755 [Myxococcota bacterium]